MKLYEKINELRNSAGLTRAQFAEVIGIPFNTMKSVISKKTVPSGHILVAIAKVWPEHARWLLLGDGALELTQGDEFLVVDVVDSRFMNHGVIKPERYTKLTFLQSRTEESLGAILSVDESNVYKANELKSTDTVVLLKAGNMNFSRGNGGGWLVLSALRLWLEDINPDLIRTAEFCSVSDEFLIDLYSRRTFFKSALTPSLEGSQYQNFLKWREGEGY